MLVEKDFVISGWQLFTQMKSEYGVDCREWFRSLYQRIEENTQAIYAVPVYVIDWRKGQREFDMKVASQIFCGANFDPKERNNLENSFQLSKYLEETLNLKINDKIWVIIDF